MIWPIQALRRAFVGASVTWMVALPLATFASSRPDPATPVYLVSFGTYLVGSLLCHQRPERSFFLWGSQMPVCARCTGIYAGAAIAALALPLVARLTPSRRRSPAKRGALHWGRTLLIVSIVPAAATLGYEWTTGNTPANWIRAVSGLPVGAVVAWIVRSAAPERPRG
jgi:uncharacterized membrane protein